MPKLSMEDIFLIARAGNSPNRTQGPLPNSLAGRRLERERETLTPGRYNRRFRETGGDTRADGRLGFNIERQRATAGRRTNSTASRRTGRRATSGRRN